MQKIAERALRPAPAAGAVVMDVDTGRLLAMVSKPAFDPNEMSGHLTPEAEQRLLADRYKPLHDKTVGETYYPGSTFKAVSAIAALEDRLVTPEEKTKCHGSFELARHVFKCTKTHLTVNLYDAIVQSCNVYFYELGARPGMMDRLAKFGADLGLGAPTGLGLNGEEGGFLPTEEWYREQKRKNPKAEGFQIGHALNAVIGQGSTRVTLLQMATLYAAIANGGKLWLPQIVERVESPDGQGAGGVPAARPPRAGGLARDAGDRARRRWSASSTSPRGRRSRRARRTSRSRARPARRRCRAAHADGRLRVRRRTPGSSASRRPGGRASPRGAGRARRPRRRRRRAAGDGDRRQLLRDASPPAETRRARRCRGVARRVPRPAETAVRARRPAAPGAAPR